MNKLVLLLPLFLITMCGEAPVTPPAHACSPPLDGSDFTCPPWDFELDDPKPKPLIPRQELKGEVDIYDPMHWHSINQMFIRNARKTKIEKNMTQPEDAINKALAEFNYGSNGSSESKELLQLSSNGNQ